MLKLLLGTKLPVEKFFRRYFERKPVVVRNVDKESPWAVRASELPSVWAAAAKDTRAECLILKDCAPTSSYESAHAAFLDGCSVVVNRADFVHVGARWLCKLLRDSCPHAYCQLYATPPRSKAVEAHADDHDVFVLQCVGSKRWRVYSDVPVRWPGPHEQVGKNQPLPADDDDFWRRVALDVVLQEGDALYVPRGFVHEAEAHDTCSLHLTVALATHDWTWNALGGAGGRRAVDFALLRPRLRSQRALRIALARARCRRFDVHTLDDLIRAYERTVRPHNDLQDTHGLSVRSPRLNRVVRPSTPPQRRRRRRGGGITARSDLADVLPLVLQGIGTRDPVAIADFGGDRLDDISKFAFAQVCIDLGLLVRSEEEEDLQQK